MTFYPVPRITNNEINIIVGTLLTALIRQGDFPGIIQKMGAYYVIYDLYKSDGQNESPFLSVFLSVLEIKDPGVTGVNLIERNFVGQLLNSGTKEFAKQAIGSVLQQELLPLQFELNALKIQCSERHKELPTTVKSGLMNIIPAPSSAPPISETSVKDLMEGFVKSDTPLRNVFAPQFMRIAPPLLPVEDELVWFDITNPAWHKPIYDTTISNVSSEAKRLIALVFNEALNIQDRQVLLAELEKDPNMVYHIGLTPAKVSF